MLPHEERVIIEKEELDGKIDKLITFMNSDTYRKLPILTSKLLANQLSIMEAYSGILGLRIKLFSGDSNE